MNKLYIIKKKLSDKETYNEYIQQMRYWAQKYPNAGYGGKFYAWAVLGKDNDRYKSFGNGSAMRSGIIGSMFPKVEDVIKYAALASAPTHSHPDGIKGGIVTAVLVWMAYNGYSKKAMKKYICKQYPKINNTKKFFNQVHPAISLSDLTIPHRYQTRDITCNTAVPLAFINFLFSNNYEECLRNCLQYSSDSDTVMAISGGIASAFYGEENFQVRTFSDIVKAFLPEELVKVVFLT